jgi:DnaJ-class molecular chaperone
MKTPIHTHYDNLKVARDAPVEVIRAAYRTLSKKYHPDHNPDNPAAMRITQLINSAYDVLSDPARRKEHDDWIAREEAAMQASTLWGSDRGFSTSRGAAAYASSPRHSASRPDMRGGAKRRPAEMDNSFFGKLLASCDQFFRQFSRRSKP